MLTKSKRKRMPTVVGTGLVALDVVFKEDQAKPIGRWAGGTCGNVLSILGWLGWDSYPVARFRAGSEANAIKRDLRRWKVKTDLITQSDKGSTPVILQYIKRDKDGGVFHRFKMRCPVCGNRLPSFRPVTGNCVESLASKLPDADVFFFDRTSRGILDLAARYFEDGALIVFEPCGIGEQRHFEEAIEISHVVKFSNDRIKASEVPVPDSYPYLHIETMGSKGLRYRCQLEKYSSDGWEKMPANNVSSVRDTAGAGDWCTAGLLQRLSHGGAESLTSVRKTGLRSAIQLGQAMSAWSCSFESARGGMYHSTVADFCDAIDKIMDGDDDNEVSPDWESSKSAPYLCVACES
jgi:fructokinase